MTDISALIERLEKRAKEDEACAENNRAVADALQDQMEHFEARDGMHNTYAVRMAVDHRSGMKRDQKYADDLRSAISLLASRHQEPVNEPSDWERMARAQSRKLQAVLHVPGVKDALRELDWENGDPLAGWEFIRRAASIPKVEPTPVVTDEAWRQVTGHLLKEAERMCGPGPMLDALTASLQKQESGE